MYLNEYYLRYNNKNLQDYERFDLALANINIMLSCKNLIVYSIHKKEDIKTSKRVVKQGKEDRFGNIKSSKFDFDKMLLGFGSDIKDNNLNK